MGCRWTELIFDANDPERLAQFWSQVLDYEIGEREEGKYAEIRGPEGSGPGIVFVRVPEPKSVKNRLHIDVNATDRDQKAEVERIMALGAREIDVGQGDAPWVVLADPEGNELCVLRSRVPA